MSDPANPEDVKPADRPHADDDMAAAHTPTSSTPKKRQSELLDEGLEETFPASDPVSAKHIT